jgi:phosphatidate cytidylyltransferase
VATTDAGSPSDEPRDVSIQPVKKTSRAGRDLPAAIAVGVSIGAVLIATMLWFPWWPAMRWSGGCARPGT